MGDPRDGKVVLLVWISSSGNLGPLKLQQDRAGLPRGLHLGLRKAPEA